MSWDWRWLIWNRQFAPPEPTPTTTVIEINYRGGGKEILREGKHFTRWKGTDSTLELYPLLHPGERTRVMIVPLSAVNYIQITESDDVVQED